MHFRHLLNGITCYLWALIFSFISAFYVCPLIRFFDNHAILMKPKTWEATLFSIGLLCALVSVAILLRKSFGHFDKVCVKAEP